MLFPCSESCRGGWWIFAKRALVLLLVIIGGSAETRAQAGGASSRDFWVGASASEEIWLLFTGATVAPYGTLHEPGFRLRAMAGYGEYDTENQAGSVLFQDALLGYQAQLGSLTMAVYAGASVITRDYLDVQWRDADTLVITSFSGVEWGPKAAADIWYDAGGDLWASLNASYTTAFNTYAVRGRLGWKVGDGLSIGPELSVDDNSKQELALDAGYQRAGAFARYSWGNGEISVSAGMSRQAEDDPAPYATIGIYSHY